MSYTKRNCDNCGKEYLADNRNLKRGWGLTCSKSCAAKKREMSKPGYNPQRVEENNKRRANWNENYYGHQEITNWDPADDMYWNDKDF